MKITALVENTSKCSFQTAHGLSLHIETAEHNILFDMGPDDLFLKNAQKKNIDISAVDIAIVSHGHSDHGGGLCEFIKANSKAKIYIQKSAFKDYFSVIDGTAGYIGLDKSLENSGRIVLLDGDFQIDSTLEIFVTKNREKLLSSANDTLFCGSEKDTFSHEQNLIIKENGKTALIMGCGHCGIVNILEEATKKFEPQICVGGYHLYNPRKKETVSKDLLFAIGEEMAKYSSIKFFTCHCTGEEAFLYLSKKVNSLKYLSCGESIEF